MNAADNNGGTALTEATVQGIPANVRLLLESGADVEARVSTARYTALMLAAAMNSFELVRMLVDAGADVNAVDANGSSVLMWAAYASETGDPCIAEYLVKAGADVSVVNRRKETALTWANWHGKTAMTTYLEGIQQGE